MAYVSRFRVSGSGLKGYHQPPEVNYWAVLTFGEIKQEVHAQVYHAGEIDVCENLDIVHFWWLVVGLLNPDEYSSGIRFRPRALEPFA